MQDVPLKWWPDLDYLRYGGGGEGTFPVCRWYAALESFGRSRPGHFYAHQVGPRVDPWLYRATGGRWPSILGGVSTAPLMTTGAKSGQPRQHQITYFHDGPDPIVTASNYGGPKHPQWYYNLKAHPECELGGEELLATEITDTDDYARVYGLAEQVYAGWSDYRLKTDPIGRRIPVFRLTPRLAAASTATPGPPTAR